MTAVKQDIQGQRTTRVNHKLVVDEMMKNYGEESLNVWGKGQARLLCAAIGMGVGYVVAMLTGVLPGDALHVLSDLPFFALP